MNEELLEQYGIDYERGMRNCMGNAEFYKKILSMFEQDTCYRRAAAAYEKKDQRALFLCMHELKGTSGNAGLTGLYGASVKIVELLRGGQADEKQVESMFADVTGAYKRTCDGICYILAQN